MCCYIHKNGANCMEETVPVNRFHLIRDVSQIYVMYSSNRIIFEKFMANQCTNKINRKGYTFNTCSYK